MKKVREGTDGNAEHPIKARLDVHFFEKPRWDLSLKTAQARDFRNTSRRVLTLSQYVGVARQESQFDFALARKMAWVILRARAAGNYLRTIQNGW